MIGAVHPLPQVTITHTGPVFTVERHVIALRNDARTLIKDVVRHPGAVTVIAVKSDGTLVLVRNQRIAVGQALVEFCAGKLERGEAPARELEEETGFSAGKIERLGEFFTSPGFTDECMHVFLATDLTPVPQRLEPGEELEVVTMSVAQLRAQIARGEILDGKTLGAFLLWSLRAETSTEIDTATQTQTQTQTPPKQEPAR